MMAKTKKAQSNGALAKKIDESPMSLPYTYPKRFAAPWATRPAKMAINELANVALAKMRLMDCSPNWR
jgi:hypothetical protein